MKNTKRKLAEVRKALSGRQVPLHLAAAIRGGDDREVYPWIDQPGG